MLKHNKTLKVLDLSYNGLDSEAAILPLVEALRANSTLTDLYLRSNDFGLSSGARRGSWVNALTRQFPVRALREVAKERVSRNAPVQLHFFSMEEKMAEIEANKDIEAQRKKQEEEQKRKFIDEKVIFSQC